MELDKRIKNNHRPLCVIDIKWAMGFIGQNGFFADAINCFSNLSECQSGLLISVKDKKLHPFECDNQWHYTFFIPEEWVKEPEKKYRPYTIKDFEKALLNGEFEDFIIFRDKHNPDDIYTMRYNGNFRKGQFEYICLGAKNFSFESLFENYEVADYDGEWQPFGVVEDD